MKSGWECGQGRNRWKMPPVFKQLQAFCWPWTDQKIKAMESERHVIICAAVSYRNNANLSTAKLSRLIYMPLSQRHDNFNTWFDCHTRKSPYVNFCKEFSRKTFTLFLTKIYFSKCLYFLLSSLTCKLLMYHL